MATEKVILNKDTRRSLPWQLKAAGAAAAVIGTIAGINSLSETFSTPPLPVLPDYCQDSSSDKTDPRALWCYVTKRNPALVPVFDDPKTTRDERMTEFIERVCLANGKPATNIFSSLHAPALPSPVTLPSGQQETAYPFRLKQNFFKGGFETIWVTETGFVYQAVTDKHCIDGMQSPKSKQDLALKPSSLGNLLINR